MNTEFLQDAIRALEEEVGLREKACVALAVEKGKAELDHKRASDALYLSREALRSLQIYLDDVVGTVQA